MNRMKQPQDETENHGAVDGCVVHAERRRAQLLEDAQYTGEHDGHADEEAHEHRAARHNISPIDRSKIRMAAYKKPGDSCCRCGAGTCSHRSALHQILEDGLQIVVRRRDFLDRAILPGSDQVRQALVELVGLPVSTTTAPGSNRMLITSALARNSRASVLGFSARM